MRVSTQMYPQTLLGQLGKLTQQQQKLQNQVSTGLRVQEVSDDPSAARKIMVWQADKAAITQYRKNIESQQNVAAMNAGMFDALNGVSRRVNEIAIKSDDTWSKEALQLYAQEVDGLIEKALSTSNTKFNGKYLLAGTASDQTPFVADRNAEGRITGVSFQGNSHVASVETSPENTLSAQWVGASTANGNQPGLLQDQAQGVDFFRHLIELRDHLEAGDIEAIQTQDIQNLQGDEDHLIQFGAMNGARQAQMEAALGELNDQEFALTGMISKEGDADMAETIVRLNEVQYAYQAALQSGAKIMNSSLMDYLR